MSVWRELRRRAWEANMALAESGLVVETFGNASASDPGRGVFAIKPSGVPYGDLAPGMMVVVDFDGKVVDGRLRPSSDTPTHAVLYGAFAGIGGVVHTHSSCATAWAQAMRAIPCLGTTHADHLPGPVPCTAVMSDAQIKGEYELETGRLIAATFRDISPEETGMVLVAGHGPFTWGSTPEEAVYRSVMLEEIARMASLTLEIAPDTPVLQDSLIEKHYSRKHGNNAYYGN